MVNEFDKIKFPYLNDSALSKDYRDKFLRKESSPRRDKEDFLPNERLHSLLNTQLHSETVPALLITLHSLSLEGRLADEGFHRVTELPVVDGRVAIPVNLLQLSLGGYISPKNADYRFVDKAQFDSRTIPGATYVLFVKEPKK